MRKSNGDIYSECPKEEIVHQMLEVQAQVTVIPLVEHGTPKVHCLDSEILRDNNWDTVSCRPCHRGKCTFILRQIICVEVPITIDADVEVEQGISRCGKPEFGPCKHHCKNTDEE